MSKEKIVIIDGNSLINRAFYALPPLTNSKGVHTNAVYGFTNMLFKIMSDEKPDYIAAAFDRKAPTFRHKEYAEYKAGRRKTPSELNEQFPLVKDVLKAFKVGIYEIDGFEADDILGTISKKFEKDMDVIIYTGDKDALQLISGSTRVAITRKGISEVELFDENTLLEKYEATPAQFIDIKGLMGDSSDNIPGVPGVGEKTAVKLIKEFGSIENLVKNTDKIGGKKVKELVETYSEQALFSKRLATIVTDVPMDFDLKDMKTDNPDNARLRELFQDMEFKSLISKVTDENSKKEGAGVLKKYGTAGREDILQLIEKARASGILSMAVEIKGTDFFNTDILGIALSWDGKDAIYVEPGHEYINMLKEIIEDDNIRKICHNAKNDIVSLHKHGISLSGLEFDTAIASYLLNPSQSTYNVDEIVSAFLGERLPSSKEIGENIKNNKDASLAKDYLCAQCVYIFRLHKVLEQRLKDNDMLELYRTVEHPLIEVLAFMEIEGFTVDSDMLLELKKEFGDAIDALTSEIYSLAGEEFNINSPKQLGYILFERLNLPVIKKTKTGYSTDAEVLEKLSSQHEIVGKILEFRQIMKLKSTYVDGLLNIIKEDKKIHSSFNQTVTATGRISSTEPNMQNIPVKDEMGKRIRKVFVPSNDDYLILSADYSQIELRVLAHIAKDDNLIGAFYKKMDIHQKTASEVFNVPIGEVTPLMRSRAKAVNFGIVYGISDFGLSQNLGIPRSEAKTYIDNYLSKYKGIGNYMDEIIKFAKQKGYVLTIMNRKRYIPEITSTNFNIRSLGERLAMNSPIQGSAADIIKIAMIKVYERLINGNYRSKLILQVHDELIVEAHREELEEVKEIVKDSMENALKLDVPLEVDINIGESWFDAK